MKIETGKWKLEKGQEKDPTLAKGKPARVGHPKAFFGIKTWPPAKQKMWKQRLRRRNKTRTLKTERCGTPKVKTNCADLALLPGLCATQRKKDSIFIAVGPGPSPHPPQPPASSFKSLYRKRASTLRSCVPFGDSRFRYNTKTYRELSASRLATSRWKASSVNTLFRWCGGVESKKGASQYHSHPAKPPSCLLMRLVLSTQKRAKGDQE